MCLWRCVWEGYSDSEREPLCHLKVSRGSVAVNQWAEACLPDGYQCLCKVLRSPAVLEREAGAPLISPLISHIAAYFWWHWSCLSFFIASVLWIQPRLLAEAESSRNWSSSVTFFSLLSGEINYCLVTGNHFSLLKQITQGSYVCASYEWHLFPRGCCSWLLEKGFKLCVSRLPLLLEFTCNPVFICLWRRRWAQQLPATSIALCFVKDWSSSRGQTDWRAEEGLCHLLSPESVRYCQPGGCCRVAHCHLTWV